MKYMFISDIHGNVNALEECINVFWKEAADKLIMDSIDRYWAHMREMH